MSSIGLSFKRGDDNSGWAYLGAVVADDAGKLVVRSIPAGTPAYEQGLNSGDQIVAVDGYRASKTFLESYLDERKPKDTIKLTVFRYDKLRDVKIVLGADGRRDYSFGKLAEPTDLQKKLYHGFLNADL
ncbi:MAG: PDZ domain-containing protein [Chloracidobacterium sp.]|nr:PDZ domain-containing protein [Chloracidobacterium sp.]